MAGLMAARSSVSKPVSGIVQDEAAKRNVSRVFIKTRKCRFFGMGICTKGDACTYAHNREELRPVPDFSRTKLCPAVLRGEVCTNSFCKFAHAKDEKRKLVGTVRQGEGIHNAVSKHASLGDGAEVRPLQAPSTQASQPETVAARKKSDGPYESDVHRRLRLRGCRGGKRRSGGKCVETLDEPASSEPANESSHDNASCDAMIPSLKVTPPVSCSIDVVVRKAAGAEKDPPIFYKTKMCRFYSNGTCTKGMSCSFAHDELDLRPFKDLGFSGICPILITTGECHQASCTYPHSVEDLRIVYSKNSSSTEHGSDVATTADFCRSLTPSTDAEESDGDVSLTCTFSRDISQGSNFSNSSCPSPASEESDGEEVVDAMLIVQNTFLTFEPPQLPLERRLRRVSSAPGSFQALEEPNIQENEELQQCRRNCRSKTACWLSRPKTDDLGFDDEGSLSASRLAGVGGA